MNIMISDTLHQHLQYLSYDGIFVDHAQARMLPLIHFLPRKMTARLEYSIQNHRSCPSWTNQYRCNL